MVYHQSWLDRYVIFSLYEKMLKIVMETSENNWEAEKIEF